MYKALILPPLHFFHFIMWSKFSLLKRATVVILVTFRKHGLSFCFLYIFKKYLTRAYLCVQANLILHDSHLFADPLTTVALYMCCVCMYISDTLI